MKKSKIMRLLSAALVFVMVFGLFTFFAPEGIVLTANAVSYIGDGSTDFDDGDMIRIINKNREGKSKSEANYWYEGLSWKTDRNDYVVWDGTGENTFHGVYPVTAKYDSFTIPTDQNDDEYLSAADWMTASYIGKKADGNVKLNFKHLLAKVTVNITEWNTEFDEAQRVITDPKIYSKGTEIGISYGTGTDGANKYTSDGTLTAITPVVDGQTFTAIVAPAAYAVTDEFMTLVVDNQPMAVLATANTLTGGLEPGKHYTLNLTVGKDAVSISSVTVNGWNEVNLDGGVAEEAAYIYDKSTNTYTVYKAEGLLAWNEKVQAIFADGTYNHWTDAYEYKEDFPNLTLAADITLTGENNWTPLGGFDEDGWYLSYTGEINGNGHTITGLHINNTSDSQGFVGILDGSIRNLTFADAQVTGGSYSGIIAGDNCGTIENCHVTSGSLTATAEYAGGIVGANSGTITNCTNAATIVAAQGYSDINYIGGIAGLNSGTVMGCINTGNVSGSLNIGGIVGDNDKTVAVCGNKGAVTGTAQTGGIVGRNAQSVAKTIGSWTIVTTESDADGDGIGNNSYGTVTDCYSGDAATINGKVSNMNAAIDAYNETAAEDKTCPYAWQIGTDGYPTLVEATE